MLQFLVEFQFKTANMQQIKAMQDAIHAILYGSSTQLTAQLPEKK